MDRDDPFSRELRSARDRIAELQRRSGADPAPGDGLLSQMLAELDVAIEELSVTGEELREQTDELTATRRALEAERQRYQELFEAAPVAYLVTDPMARIREANRAAAALLGVAQGFLPGKPLAAYVDGSDRWGFRTMVNRLCHGEEQRVAGRPLRLRRRDGEVVSVSVTVEPVRDRDGGLAALRWLLRGMERDEGGHPAIPVEQAMAQDDARRGHLAALEGLDLATDLDGIVQVVLDAGVRLLGVDGIGLMLADTRGRLCAAGASDGAVLGFLRAQEHAIKGPCVHAFLLDQTVRAHSLSGDPRWAGLAEAAAVHGVASALATPIGLYGGPVGVCLVVSATPRLAWSEGDMTAAEGYASVLAALLELAAEAQGGAGPPHRFKEVLVTEQVVVEQAKGALMARRGIDADAAALQLAQLARRSGRPLAEVAASLLRRLAAGPPERGGPGTSRLG
jgi:PAS domain S-box-containing protein